MDRSFWGWFAFGAGAAVCLCVCFLALVDPFIEKMWAIYIVACCVYLMYVVALDVYVYGDEGDGKTSD